jgi:GDP-4-dehydro-6-deoxy-D-mannose reductase
MRVLVTGSNGMFGSALAARLCEVRADATVVGLDLSAPTSVAGEACDLSDAAATRAAIARLAPDFVFHCAGGVTGRDLAELVSRLVTPTRVLLEALALEAPEAVFVVPGSAAEYGTLELGRTAFAETDPPAPVSPYGIAKAAQTQVAMDAAAAGFDARVGRVFNIIGPGIPPTFLVGRVAAELAKIAAGQAGPRVETGPLSSVRDFVDIRDASDGLLAVAERGLGGRSYNICSGVGRTSREVVEALVRCSGQDVEIAEEAAGSPRTGLDVSVGDPSRIAREIGWQPIVDFETSACDAVAAARESLPACAAEGQES